MKNLPTTLIGFFLGIIISTPISSAPELTKHSGSSYIDIFGGKRNISISKSINDEFCDSSQTVQYIHNNYPSTDNIDQYYGNLSIQGLDPMISVSGRYYAWASDLVNRGSGHKYDLYNLRLEIEDLVTDWTSHNRIHFLDESANQYDCASWWGDNPTNDLPPLLDLNRLELTNAGGNSPPLHPVPLPTAFWLFAYGLINLVSMTCRTSID